MHNTLKFVITRTNGEKLEQEIPCIPEKVGECMRDMFLQYANMGMIKKEGDKFILLCASQIAYAEVEIPQVVLASGNDLPKPAGSDTVQGQGRPPGGVTLA